MEHDGIGEMDQKKKFPNEWRDVITPPPPPSSVVGSPPYISDVRTAWEPSPGHWRLDWC